MYPEIIIIEFSNDGKPFTVITKSEYGSGHDIYDFDWSKNSKCFLYHQSGGGSWPYKITHKEYWVKECAQALFLVNEKKGLKLRENYDPTDLFKDNWNVTAQYCSICKDWIPTEDPCKHLWWDDKVGLYLEVSTCCEKFEDEYTYYFGLYDFDPEERCFYRTKDELRIDKCPYCGKMPTIKVEG